jgi:hypothetical protein
VRVLVMVLVQGMQRLVLAVAHSTRVELPNQDTKKEVIGRERGQAIIIWALWM